MAGTAEFDEFVRTRSGYLLRIAYLLTGDHTLAEDLLQTSLARSWSAWRRVHGDPEAYVRQIMLNTYNSWWRRRWNGERPTEALPEQPIGAPQAAVDDRDEVWRALSRLPRQQRLVLVLRYFEDLSEAEIASTLRISAGSVKSHASKALARLRLDPSLQALPLPAHDDVPAGNERLAAVRERITRRRRGRLATLAAACAVVLAAIGGYVVAPRYDIADFPEYYKGYHIVLRAQARIDERPATFTFTPSSMDLALFPTCRSTSRGLLIMMSVSINGERFGGVGCGEENFMTGRTTYSVAPPVKSLRDVGVEIGKPATVTLTIDEVYAYLASPSPGGPLSVPGGTPPGNGIMAVAIGEAVPFEEFPLPPRPAKLKPLERISHWSDSESMLIESNGPHSATVEWGLDSGLGLYARSQTPGMLRIKINGIEVNLVSWWDYKQGSWQGGANLSRLQDAGVNLRPGTKATITVEPEHMTGDWYLQMRLTL